MRLMKAGGTRAVKRVLVVLVTMVAMMMVQVLLLGMDSLMVAKLVFIVLRPT